MLTFKGAEDVSIVVRILASMYSLVWLARNTIPKHVAAKITKAQATFKITESELYQ